MYMELNYYNKYIKYKEKYLNLKNNQKGGTIHYGNRMITKESIVTKNKKYLVVVPAGNNSYHTQWYNSNLFDLFTIYYGDDLKKEQEYKNNSAYFIKRKGPKWQLIRYVFTQYNFNWKNYKYIWLPDDDLKISRNDVEEFLSISDKLKFKLSQPSLNAPNLPIDQQLKIINHWNQIKEKSKNYVGWLDYYKQNKNKFTDIISQYISYKILLQQYPKKEKKIRYTTFVEIMCPLFEIDFFQKVIPMLNKDYIQSGFGLDTLWGLMLDHTNMGVIDYISVVHMRPVGNFQKKKTGNFKVLTIDPHDEEKKIYANSKIKFRKVYKKTINTISLNNKIAFLFLTREDVNYPNIWNEYFNDKSKFNIYMHPKNKNNVKSFMKNYIIKDLVVTEWGRGSIIVAMINLLKAAIKDNDNKMFVFLSESCLPIKSLSILHQQIINSKKSYLKSMPVKGNTLKRFTFLKQPENLGITQKNFKKAETWCILTRHHVETIIKYSEEFIKSFYDIYVPEEHLFITLLNLKHPNEIIDKTTTIVYWDESGPQYIHPKTFGPILNQKYKKIINNLLEQNKNAFFMRKWKYDKKNNVYSFISQLIK